MSLSKSSSGNWLLKKSYPGRFKSLRSLENMKVKMCAKEGVTADVKKDVKETDSVLYSKRDYGHRSSKQCPVVQFLNCQHSMGKEGWGS